MTVPPSRRTFRRWLAVAIAVAAVVVVVLLVLIGVGVLTIPPSHTPTPVTITKVVLEIQQGNTSGGVPWFGPSPVTFTTGFPIQVAPGSTWSVVWEHFPNFDQYNHTISQVTPSAPFVLSSTLPALPDHIGFDSESNNLAIYMQAPSTSGGTYVVTVIVSALTVG